MSKNTSDELFDMPPSTKEAPPAKPTRKVAAKKSATKAAKKTATKTAKKTATKAADEKAPETAPTTTAAKKVTAKKAAKKAPAKKAAKKATKEIVSKSEPVEQAAPKQDPPPRHQEPSPEPRPQQSERSTPDHQEPQRIGRVPGGGPVNQSPNRQDSGNQNDGQQPQRESRSKKRREKRKRRRENSPDQNQNNQGNQGHQVYRNNNQRNDRNNRFEKNDRPQEDRSPTVLEGPLTDTDGIIEIAPKGFGFLRLAANNFEQLKEDIFISPEMIRNHSLRHGQWIHGQFQGSNRGLQLVEIKTINGITSEEAAKLPHFDELKAINPYKRIAFETTPERYTTRVVDIVAPVGRGQRGLIVSPPRSGKTTLLLHMAEAIRDKYDEQIHLMILLVDERPEEVTEFRRALPEAEIFASSNDEQARNHTRIAELAIERAKRLVEAGKDVFLLMDSITRLARAYNGAMSSGKGARGRGTGSGGITIGALEIPRRLFAAARNTREAGSLTILATALIQTNSRADEAIYMEFKGTGNMELVLDRKIAESYIYPAVDIFRSGTRREELLLPEHTLHKIHLIRRGLSGHRPFEAMERLLYFIKKFPNNPQMLLEIKG